MNAKDVKKRLKKMLDCYSAKETKWKYIQMASVPNRSGLQKGSMLARRLAVNVEADDVLYLMREIENKQLIKQLNNLLHW